MRGSPVCQTASRQVHCYYTRTVTDLCWADFQVQMKLHVRRFVCANALCPRRTFAERLREPIKAYARRSKRCDSRLQTIGLLLGGNAGALLAKRMGLPVSSATLLRLVRALEAPQRATPEVLGRDDFADAAKDSNMAPFWSTSTITTWSTCYLTERKRRYLPGSKPIRGQADQP